MVQRSEGHVKLQESQKKFDGVDTKAKSGGCVGFPQEEL